MAITSVAGATLTKLHSGTAAGSPCPARFSTQSYCGWIKIPSIGTERILFDHDGRLKIGIDTAGKLFLLLDGVNRFTGTTVCPTNKWVFWGFRRQSGNLHTVRLSWLECVSNNPVLQTLLTEINVTQSFAPGDPTQFTLHVPAGCSICGFRYGTNGVNVSTSSSTWAIGNNNHVWETVLRFPNDLYDHREISASSGDTTFNGMHNWSSQVGTVVLDVNGDPEHLLDKNCTAIIGILTSGESVFTMDTPGGTVPGSSTVVVNRPVVFPIRTDVMPATAVVGTISIDGFVTITEPALPRVYPNYGVRWNSNGTLLPDNYHTHGNNFINYYVWQSMWDGPDPNPPTLNDLYNSTFEVLNRWTNSGAGIANAVKVNSFEIGIHTIYQGQLTPGTCGAGPPAAVGTIIVDKVVLPNNGESFTFNAVNLTPNSFTLDDAAIQQYNNVPAGNGYGITEIVPAGWSVSYSVSNGSPHDNISVVAGDTVVVTVTNTKLPNELSGLYKIVPEKRQDTLWLEGFVGTRDVKIP